MVKTSKAPQISKKKSRRTPVTANLLQVVAGSMFPFYKKIARSPRFSKNWAKAVRQANLEQLEKLFQKAAPRTAKRTSLGVNGIGYFVNFPVKAPINEYVNATSIRPGTVQFYFNAKVHSLISRAILPLYIQLACNRCFARQVAKAIRTRDQAKINQLICRYVKSRALCSISFTNSGFSMGFKYRFSPYKVYHEFFKDTFM